MIRPLRSALLILVLLLQGLTQAWALPPVSSPATAEAQSAMPCHDDAGMADRMPCCDDQQDCRCSAACFGATGALAPGFSVFGELPGPVPHLAAAFPGPLAAHPMPLLRPPADSGS